MSKNVFIGCSSYNEIPQKYFKEAAAVASICATKGYDLVFGCYRQGLMKEIYEEYLKHADRKITGICMKKYENDIADIEKTTEVKIFNTTLEQIEYFMTCDKLIYLPGGYDTLTELIYLINAACNGIHNKEIIIVNTCGFYDNIINHFNKLFNEGFIKNKTIYIEIKNIEELNDIL